MPAFKRRYRDLDVLLIDDIQFLERTQELQEEFFHTFNDLHQGGSQIVISSDRPPKSIATLEDRLRTRFEWGLITDVQPPEFETRLAILRKKAESEHLDGIPTEVHAFIASNITDNVRELEGALIRVAAYSSLNHSPLSEEIARTVLADLLPPSKPRVITPQLILDETAKMFGWTVDDLCGKSRRRPLVTARQISMYVFRELTDATRRSPKSSGDGITPPSCTRWRRSRGRWPSGTPSSSRSTSSLVASSSAPVDNTVDSWGYRDRFSGYRATACFAPVVDCGQLGMTRAFPFAGPPGLMVCYAQSTGPTTTTFKKNKRMKHRRACGEVSV
jgi:hypothetical protein